MDYDLPTAGAANEEIAARAHQEWLDAARASGVILTGFDASLHLADRLAWAISAGLAIGAIYTRFSTKLQDSTADQIRACIIFAARNKMYVPPEFICVDEAAKGRSLRRAGLDRLRLILKSKRATVLLVFKVSRLFRQAYQGYQLFQNELVEEGLRGISVSQGIDTEDKKAWKPQCHLHGLLDDLLLDTIADHCREGLIGLFKNGFVTGALTVGYRAVEVPGAPPTKRGRPRTMPAKNTEVAAMIVQHYEWIRDGLPIREGLRRWRAAGGPCDPRATTKKMNYQSYLRMLSNVRYTGRWEFGRKRNSWSAKRDYTRQMPQADKDVQVYLCEELRIVSDELFAAVQQRLLEQKIGPRGPRKSKELQLRDLLTDIFYCPNCERRFYTCGAHGNSMQCPNLECPSPVMVCRAEAIANLCEDLAQRLNQNEPIIEQIVAATQRLDDGDHDHAKAFDELERRIRSKDNRIVDLTEMVGEGTHEEREDLKSKVRSTRAEKAALQLELARLRKNDDNRQPVTAEEVKAVLAEFGMLLQDAGSGKLGAEAIYRAADIVRQLVNGRVWVHAETRAGRKRAVVHGRYSPRLLPVVANACEVLGFDSNEANTEVTCWLRCPPRLDAKAEEIRGMYEEENLGFRTIAKILGIGCGNVYASYLRYYEIKGEPVPPRRPRGRHRRSA